MDPFYLALTIRKPIWKALASELMGSFLFSLGFTMILGKYASDSLPFAAVALGAQVALLSFAGAGINNAAVAYALTLVDHRRETLKGAGCSRSRGGALRGTGSLSDSLLMKCLTSLLCTLAAQYVAMLAGVASSSFLLWEHVLPCPSPSKVENPASDASLMDTFQLGSLFRALFAEMLFTGQIVLAVLFTFVPRPMASVKTEVAGTALSRAIKGHPSTRSDRSSLYDSAEVHDSWLSLLNLTHANEEKKGAQRFAGPCVGFAVTVGVMSAASLSGAVFNPTFGAALWTINVVANDASVSYLLKILPLYALAEFVGATIATLLFWLISDESDSDFGLLSLGHLAGQERETLRSSAAPGDLPGSLNEAHASGAALAKAGLGSSADDQLLRYT